MAKVTAKRERVEDTGNETVELGGAVAKHTEQLNRLKEKMERMEEMLKGIQVAIPPELCEVTTDQTYFRTAYQASPGQAPVMLSSSGYKGKALAHTPPDPGKSVEDRQFYYSAGEERRTTPFVQQMVNKLEEQREWVREGRCYSREISLVRNERQRQSLEPRRRSPTDPRRRAAGDFGGWTRVEPPLFDGEDWKAWSQKDDQFIRVNQILPQNRTQVMSDFLMGKAWDFYGWMCEEEPDFEWDDIKLALGQRFGPKEVRSIHEQLMGLRQTGGIEEYGDKFQTLAARIRGMDRETSVEAFMNGLSRELRDNVRIMKPRNVYEALMLALTYETKLKGSRAKEGNSNSNPWRAWRAREGFGPATQNVQANGPVRAGSALATRTEGGPPRTALIMPPPTERQRRRDANLCYKCGEAWEPGHHCKGHLRTLETESAEKLVEGHNSQPEILQEADG